MRSFPVLLLAILACGSGAASEQPKQHAPSDSTAAIVSGGSVALGREAGSDSGAARGVPASGIVRGLYITRWKTQSPKRMREFIALADSTEVNALVLDLKDEFGLNYKPADATVARNAGNAGAIPNLRALVDSLKAHDIIPIARLVVFKDSVAARVNPEHTIRKADGSPWRDKEGLTWVSPYDRTIWEYNIKVAEELARLGFEEIQFDYIRFPEPYKSLPPQVFPGAKGQSKPDVLAEFMKTACGRINAAGARCTADIFGLVTTVPGALEIGQQWEKLAPVTDVLLPMVYPSHYPRGAFGVARPNADPYTIVYKAINRARERNEKLGIENPEHVRAWLQAFTIGEPKYGAEQIAAQKRAVYDAGYDGWILWHPGSTYAPFLAALEKTEVSRKKVAGAKPAAAADSGALKADTAKTR